MNISKISSCVSHVFLLLCLVLFVPGGKTNTALAALTDISTAPIFTEVTATTEVKPNIMFIMDDSGSMDWDYMPDNAADFQASTSFFSTTYRVGGASSHCNGVYYNPNITYTPPVRADGTNYPDASFTAAWRDGYNTGSGTTNLSTSFKSSSSDASQPAYYWTYSGTQTTEKLKDYYNTSSTFYRECRSRLTGGTTGVIQSGEPGVGKFTRVVVGSAERTNFANWYSYYRTRMLMMKTAAGHAFRTIDDHFRVGFMSLNNNDSPAFLNISDFDSTQKANWYDKLYGTDGGDSTPLRQALSNAGLIYAGKKDSLYGETIIDPVQYSCQQNYTILSTDGFWNGSGGKKLDGANMDSPDSALPRPYNDGGYAQTQARTSQLQQRTVTVQARQRTSQLQQRTAQLQTQTSQLQRQTRSGGNWGSWQNVSSCDANNNTRCQYVDGSWTGTSSCDAVAKDTTDPYTVGVARSCRVAGVTSYANAASCTETSPNAGGNFTQCEYNTGSWSNVASCTVVPQSSGPAYTTGTAVECQDVVTNSAWTNVSSCTATAATPANSTGSATECQYTAFSAWSNVASCTGTPQSTGPNYTVDVARECQTLGAGGVSNTLADVAAYYYYTNLRTEDLENCEGPIIPPATTPTNLCAANRVPPSGIDNATWQHMTTFTLGLGARGRMVFSSTYLTDSVGDFHAVKEALTASSTTCTWQSSGTTCTWPVPNSDDIENIDDLWHAAVNGHGNYYSAADPAGLASGLASSLNVIINVPKPGTAAAAATTNPQITSDQDNYQFSTYFKSIEWSGELIRQIIDPATGKVAEYNHLSPNPSAYDWSAQGLLNNKDYSTREIYTKGPSGLMLFTWGNIDNADLENYFKAPHITTSPPSGMTGLSQFCAVGTDCISAAAQSNTTIATGGAAGEALVNFLRGDTSNEEGSTTDAAKFYRNRTHILGDIVSAQPQYVGPPNKNYVDTGYKSFKEGPAASRKQMVYAAANDGMLHAFNATTGQEEWAYIPSFVLPNLYTLADKNYSNKHQYFVEGTPVVSDVYFDGAWKTILVGGLNRGGKGYYALDITDPDAPALLWEFTDDNMGYTFGNPQIVKLDNAPEGSFGTWVVLLTSGYNNSGDGDGQGWLYVVDPKTGSRLSSVSTGVGSSDSPSGLAKIVAQAGSDNIVKRVYGGDLLGNLWRFDVGASSSTAQLVATLKGASGNAQSITSKPQVTTFKGFPIVYVGTGRYLGENDVPSTQTQSFYAIKDKLDGTIYDNPRQLDSFFSQTLVESTCPADAPVEVCEPGTVTRDMTVGEGSLLSKDGWVVDFPAGELSYTDSKLTQGTISFTTVLPTESTSAVCGEGEGTSTDPATFEYQLDYLTGGFIGAKVGETGVAGVYLGLGIGTAPQIVQLQDGTLVEIIRLSTGETVTRILRVGSSSGTISREAWRELISE